MTHASWLLLHPPPPQKKKHKRIGISKYEVIVLPLRKIYGFSNFASGKRLVGTNPGNVECRAKAGEGCDILYFA
jgi:hypothetical protein